MASVCADQVPFHFTTTLPCRFLLSVGAGNGVCGPRCTAPGTLRTANRVRLCCGWPFTVVNSPPYTTYSSLTATAHGPFFHGLLDGPPLVFGYHGKNVGIGSPLRTRP